jgi:actin-like protein 6A
VGSYSTRAGFAGEDSPKTVFPTVVGHHTKDKIYAVGDMEIASRKEFTEVRPIMKQGLIEDWDGLERVLEYAFHQRLRVDPKDFPVLYAVPSFATREMREKLCERLFEVHRVPGLYLSQNAVLTAFASGRSTALVFDAGHDMMSVTPVYEGYVLKKQVMKQELAGAYLLGQTEKLLEHELQIKLNPYYVVESKEPVREGQPANFKKREFPNATHSFHGYMKQKILVDFNESVCQVFERPYDES